MIGNIRRYAGHLPYPVKQGIKYIYGALPSSIRYGKVFYDTYAFLQESQWWNRQKLEEYQMRRLSALLLHAYENVLYYKKIFDERGLKPADVQNLDDLKRLPCLTRVDFISNINEMVASNIKSRRWLPVGTTSGTTGTPIQFFESRTASQQEFAFICHQWSRVGYQPGDARVELRGAINRNKPVYYDPLHKVLRLSPVIDSREIALHYLERIRAFGAEYLHGYPGAIATLAHAAKKYGLMVPFRLKAILFASENVYDWEREIAAEVFGCRVFSHYGMAEKTILAAECEHSASYHCLPQYGVTEIDPETHEIIATGFINTVNPFIRYRTTDIASTPVISMCPHCGREYFPVFEKVEGRLEDFIITPDGALIAPAIITHPFKNIKTIQDSQVIQKSETQIILRVAPWRESNHELLISEVDRLRRDLEIILGEKMKVTSEVVAEIPRPVSGKFKWIKSEISKDSLEHGIIR